MPRRQARTTSWRQHGTGGDQQTGGGNPRDDDRSSPPTAHRRQPDTARFTLSLLTLSHSPNSLTQHLDRPRKADPGLLFPPKNDRSVHAEKLSMSLYNAPTTTVDASTAKRRPLASALNALRVRPALQHPPMRHRNSLSRQVAPVRVGARCCDWPSPPRLNNHVTSDSGAVASCATVILRTVAYSRRYAY